MKVQAIVAEEDSTYLITTGTRMELLVLDIELLDTEGTGELSQPWSVSTVGRWGVTHQVSSSSSMKLSCGAMVAGV
jgi:hypothetical protein